jgi:Cdc6-like AAA superfamily ATPase
MNNSEIDKKLLQQIFGRESRNEEEQKYEKLGIKFNPFPRSGTSNINSGDSYNAFLTPIDSEVERELNLFIAHALTSNIPNPDDKFISATIVGDYGSGKTQLLMYARYLLNIIEVSPERKEKPYVIYVDNPGLNLLEFIGSIISKIGEENIKKYLWENIIHKIKTAPELRNRLTPFSIREASLFSDPKNTDPFSDDNTVNYKKFLDSFVRYIPTPVEKKKFDIEFKSILTDVLENETKDTVVAYYFYEFISGDFGINKTWEALTSGSIKQLNGKEASIIKYIVKLVKKQGFTDFFILVDEFEDITEGRLTKTQVDNYVYNLRTLLDEQREWCLIFSMTTLALKKLKSVSPPLADRISSREILLQNLNKEQACAIIKNYINMAGNSNSISPFTEEGIGYLRDKVEGNTRRFLKVAFALIEKAAANFTSSNDRINKEFIENNFISIEKK